jgi:hypothetical protein
MLKTLHENRPAQLVLGLLMGICFGFLLQKGQVTKYDVIIGQLLLKDFTVVKVMLSAVMIGMIGVYALMDLGFARLQTKSGSVGSIVIGGLIFGAGFAILGYCPGTLVGAAGQGSLDALLGGIVGILVGAGIYAAIYPKLAQSILKVGDLGEITLPQFFQVNPWKVIMVLSIAFLFLFLILELMGL